MTERKNHKLDPFFEQENPVRDTLIALRGDMPSIWLEGGNQMAPPLLHPQQSERLHIWQFPRRRTT